MEKGWRKWNGEAWEHVSLSDMITHVMSTEEGQKLIMDHAMVEEEIAKAVLDGMDMDPIFKSQNLQEDIEIFDKFRERIEKVRNGQMNIKDFYADEKSDI